MEKDNRKARRLYNKLGYRVVAVDKQAERPIASSGGLKFVSTTQVVMRKDLRFPPVDTVVSACAAALMVLRLSTTCAPEQLDDAMDLLTVGNLDEFGQLLLQIVQQAMSLSQ